VAIGQVGGGGGGSGGSSSGGSGMGAWGVLAIILLVLIGISAAYVYVRRLNPPPPPQGFVKETGTAIPQVTTYGSAVPPPPPSNVLPPPPPSMPAGWQALTDPNTGAVYYYCAATGESTWLQPT